VTRLTPFSHLPLSLSISDFSLSHCLSVCVCACRYGQSEEEIEKYLERISSSEEKYEVYVQLAMWRKAADTAQKMKDLQKLQQVFSPPSLSHTNSPDPTVLPRSDLGKTNSRDDREKLAERVKDTELNNHLVEAYTSSALRHTTVQMSNSEKRCRDSSVGRRSSRRSKDTVFGK
jgi:hypothetical protein